MKKTLLAVFTLLLALACNKENNTPSDSFEAVFAAGGDFPSVNRSEEVIAEEQSAETINDVEFNCVTRTLRIQDAAGGQSGFPLFNPNASVIYPGSLLQGKSLNQATPDVIAVKRAGGTISIDVVDGNIQPSFTVEEIKKSTVSTAANNIIANSTGVVPANFEFSYDFISSKREMALKMRADYETKFVEIESSLSFSTDREYNRMLIQLNQSFYTLSFDIPSSLDGLFAPEVTPEDLARYVGAGNPATYISDVTYGRIYYMLIESTSSQTEMNARVEGSFSGLAVGASGEVDYNQLSQLENIKIKVFAFGGEAGSTIRTIGVSDLSSIVELLAESSDITTGKPVSYVVRSVYDNQIVSVQLNTEYDVKECTPTMTVGAPPYTAHWAGLSSTFGPIGAAFTLKGTEFILVNKAGDQYMVSDVGRLEGPYSIDQLGDGPCPFPSIGAACNLDGNNYEQATIMIFDESGTRYSYMLDNGRWLNIQNITELANGSSPFNLAGVGAMSFRTKDPLGPSTRIMFNKDGTLWTIYNNNPQGFSTPKNLNQLFNGHNFPSGMDGVGASIGFDIGDDHFYIFFDKTGRKYTIFGNANGQGNRYIGPFSI
ncbi:MAG: thiol-activated cytolysin family protein [Phaeodactylibacter sp.]|nr:thiol-activated cytolysin family protein [Phaeodactylibacter sp.]MCB9048633.1 thiol-activated cytolysin family protein [Lewinellaceae bacterium]